ncbi:MAG: hypothetical protein WDN46_16325 [Methylocella sp.]
MGRKFAYKLLRPEHLTNKDYIARDIFSDIAISLAVAGSSRVELHGRLTKRLTRLGGNEQLVGQLVGIDFS